jgi:stage V sporulation protein D (sporulation-specific penicillin-binding protein)
MRQYHQAVRIMNRQATEGGILSRRSRQMLRRGAVLAAVFGVGVFALLLARLYQLQIVDHERYEAMAIRQQLRSTPGALERGIIYDRNGNVLAVSATVDNVYLSPAEIAANGEDRALIARELAEILGLDEKEIYEKSGRQGSWYVTLARQVEREQADAIRRFKSENDIRGVRLESDSKRYYPNGRLACHLLGFVGVDNTGLEGIEAKYAAASGIASDIIMWSITTVAVEKLLEKGITPGVLKSANFPGGADYNHTVVDTQYAELGY